MGELINPDLVASSSLETQLALANCLFKPLNSTEKQPKEKIATAPLFPSHPLSSAVHALTGLIKTRQR